MKKFLSIGVLLTAFVLGLGAQEKKAWLFYEGLSEQTIANLTADKTNWADNGTDADGNVNNWKNAVKQSADAYWMANGEVIEELRGLKIDIGSNKDNSIHLATTKVRLTRKSTKITFPKLANGQKITIQGRSANSSATNRGIAPVQSYIKFQADESSPQTGGACIFLGNQVEGSEGTYTFVWKVETDETDSVDVQFQLTPDAGIDFSYFMIDNGDAPEVKEAQPVAYLYDGDLDSDYAYIYLSGSEAFALTEINVADTEATIDSLRQFQAVVVSPTIGADNAFLPSIKQLVAYVPVLNLNPYLYPALGFGTPVQTETNLLTILDTENAAFEGLDTSEGLELLADGAITGVQLGDYFASDLILAQAGDAVAMHVHNAKRNAYMLLPLTIDDMPVANQDNIATLIPQALQVVADTKRDVQAVGTPVITLTYENGQTVVALSASNATAIYYTLDGSEPTTASSVYAEPFTLTQDATVKAFAIGDGYTDSKVASKEAVIKWQAAVPAITVQREQGKSTVSLSNSDEGVSVYFNFNGATTAALSQLYTEPIVLDEPATIYVLAEGGDFLPSDRGSQFVGINGIDKTNIRLDTLAHFDANETDWFINNPEECGEASPKASAYYFWGKSAWSYYSTEVDHEEVVKDSEGNDSTVYYYKPDPEALRVIRPLNDNGWILKSEGQVLTGELQLAPEKGVGNGATGRFADEAIDLLNTPSKGVITFGAKGTGEPYTGRIESTVKLQAPFDVIVLCGNGNSGTPSTMVIQTSTDGTEWNTVDTLKMAETQRYIKRTRASYEGTDQVYLRVAHVGGGTKGQVYDILVMVNGERSQQYDESGIRDLQQPEGDVVRTEVFMLNGVRSSRQARGLQIVRKTYANGAVRTEKVLTR